VFFAVEREALLTGDPAVVELRFELDEQGDRVRERLDVFARA
jgi:hypothetical protein